MKKISLLILVIIFAQIPSFSCDICGCGAGSYYLGFMPQLNRNLIGVRYRYMDFHTYGHRSWENTQEYFHITEVWARIYPHKKWQVMGFLPYSFNRQQTYTGNKYLQGINDVLFLANYQLINTLNDTISEKKHSLWLGGGVKLPTGKYQYNEMDTRVVANPNFQLGTGSTDFLVNLVYTLRKNKWGINTEASYKINTSNSENYRFGNRFMTTTSFFYLRQVKNIALMPHVGFYAEYSGMDSRNQTEVEHTGGGALATSVGVDVFFKNFTWALHWQKPLMQNLGQGHIFAQNRLVVQMNVTF
ncbi:MAG: hypothetical protein NZ551_11405 [Microscillaceae bacterium]|nr:hypothetical protein [Microscillaceae bacterium]MDW8461801.1 hypothetical protein [Cytophagales bacterium]